MWIDASGGMDVPPEHLQPEHALPVIDSTEAVERAQSQSAHLPSHKPGSHVIASGGKVAKLWLPVDDIDASAQAQISEMLSMPRLYKHLAIMPDCHYGKGATVGAVMALEQAVVPNCVGVDIGCGMAAYPTGLRFEGELKLREFWTQWLARTQKTVPVGFTCHMSAGKAEREANEQRKARLEARFSAAGQELSGFHVYPLMQPAQKFSDLIDMLVRQAGTLGGGNHFLEAQRDEDGQIWLMVHSGSRNIGLKIADHYDRTACRLNERWESARPNRALSWLPLETDEGKQYLHDMSWAVSYALANRVEMLISALACLGVDFDEARMINIPHNYAALEHHFGRNVIVHRKGATRARKGEVGIIPGSMGTASYIVRGRGHEESFHSCSHGAGRAMGRKHALRELNTGQFEAALEGTFSTAAAGYLDEAPMAYKDIDTVMARQAELVDIVHELRPIITLKSGEGSVD